MNYCKFTWTCPSTFEDSNQPSNSEKQLPSNSHFLSLSLSAPNKFHTHTHTHTLKFPIVPDKIKEESNHKPSRFFLPYFNSSFDLIILPIRRTMNPNPSESSKPQDHHPLHSADYAPYPKLDPKDVTSPPPAASETWTSVPVGSESDPPPATTAATTTAPPAATDSSFPKQHPEAATFTTPRSPSAPEGPAPISGNSATTMPAESNPYVSPGPAHGPGASMKS